MAKNTQMSYAACNIKANAIGDALNNGYIYFYTGSQPANADTAVTSQTLLATGRFAADAFGAAANGVITAAAIAQFTAVADGNAAWVRCCASDGTTVIMDGTVGTSSANVVVPSVAFVNGVAVQVSSFTHTEPRAAA